MYGAPADSLEYILSWGDLASDPDQNLVQAPPTVGTLVTGGITEGFPSCSASLRSYPMEPMLSFPLSTSPVKAYV